MTHSLAEDRAAELKALAEAIANRRFYALGISETDEIAATIRSRADELKWLQAAIDKIEADERFHYEPALVEVNAPLALIQVDLKARHNVLTTILQRLLSDG